MYVLKDIIDERNLPFRYLNIYVGLPEVEESFNVTRPVSPHEVIVHLALPEFVCFDWSLLCSY